MSLYRSRVGRQPRLPHVAVTALALLLLLLLDWSLGGKLAFGQSSSGGAGNARCSDASVLTLNRWGRATVQSSTKGAGNQSLLACEQGSGAPEVWYALVMPADELRLRLAPRGGAQAAQELLLGVNTQQCSGPADTCVAAAGTQPLELTLQEPEGTLVLLQIATQPGQAGAFSLALQAGHSSLQPGKKRAQATQLCDGLAITVPSIPAGSDNVQPSCFTAPAVRPAWLGFRVAESGQLGWRAHALAGAGPTEYDWALFDVTQAGAPQLVACNYNLSSMQATAFGMTSQACKPCPVGGQATSTCAEFCSPVQVQAGHQYALLIDEYSNTGQGFHLQWRGTCRLAPAARIGLAAARVCAPGAAQLQNLSPDTAQAGVSWQWHFGDSTSSQQTQPLPHSYPFPGLYSVSLTRQGGGSCAGQSDYELVRVAPAPQLQLQTQGAACGQANGSILAQVQPAQASYQFRVDQQPRQADSLLGGLAGGLHTVVVYDQHGCTDTAHARLPQTTTSLQLKPVHVVAPGCSPGAGGAIKVSASGGQAPYSFRLDTGAAQPQGQWSGLAPGNHTVQVTDQAGCTISKSINIPSGKGLQFQQIQARDITCHGRQDGRIQVQLTGGQPPYQYRLQGQAWQSQPVFQGLGPKQYAIIAKGQGGCRDTQTVRLSQPQPLQLKWRSVRPDCHNTSDGKLVLRTKGGTAPMAYRLGGQGWQAYRKFPGLRAGRYAVAVRDSNGCSVQDSATLPARDSLQMQIDSTIGSNCAQCAQGQALATVQGGTSPYKFLPHYSSNGYAYKKDGLQHLKPGVYTGWVRDRRGCTDSAAFNVPLQGQAPVRLTLVHKKPAGCQGQPTGALRVRASGIGQPFSYARLGQAFRASGQFDSLAPGSYSIVARNSYGSRDTLRVQIPQPPQPDFQITSVVHPQCSGTSNGQVTVQAASGSANVRFRMAGQSVTNSGTFSKLGPGRYTLYARLVGGGCTADTTLQLGPAQPLQWDTLRRQMPSCHGAQDGQLIAKASGGQGPYSYTLTGHSTNNTGVFQHLPAGPYQLTVTDAQGCQLQRSGQLSQPAPLRPFVLQQQRVSCQNCTDGLIKMTGQGGTPGYTYAIDGGAFQAGGRFDSLAPCSHVLSLRDTNGCRTDTLIAMPDPFGNRCDSSRRGGSTPPTPSPGYGGRPGKPKVVVLGVQSPVCHDASNGQIQVQGLKGTGRLQYKLNSGTWQAGTTFTGLEAGKHVLWVRDSLGHTDSTHYYLQAPPPVRVRLQATTPVACAGGADGALQLAGQQGIAPYQYKLAGRSWQPSGQFTQLPAGTQKIKVRDALGCQADTAFALQAPAPLHLQIDSLQGPRCHNDNNAHVHLQAQGGRQPYQFRQGGQGYQQSPAFWSLSAGAQQFEVRDSAGCTDTVQAQIAPQPALVFQQVQTQDLTCADSRDGHIQLALQGGTPPYTGQFGQQAPQSSASGQFAWDSLAAGPYSFQVSDAQGCQRGLQLALEEPDSLAFSIKSLRAPNCPSVKGRVQFQPQVSGPGQPQFRLGQGAFQSSNNNAFRVQPGHHVAQMRDQRGCLSDTLHFRVDTTEAFRFRIDTLVPVSCHGQQDGRLEIALLGGGRPLHNRVRIDGGGYSKHPTFKGLEAGWHTISAKNSYECKVDTQIYIPGPSALRGSVQPLPDTLCQADPKRRVALSVQGGTPPYSYRLQGGLWQSDSVVAGIDTGAQTFVVRDANGCTHTLRDTLQAPQPLALQVDSLNIAACGGASQVKLAGQGGVPPYRFRAGAGAFQSAAQRSLPKQDTIQLSVRDQRGCQADTLIAPQVPAPLAWDSIQVTHISCAQQVNGGIQATLQGGTAPYAFSLDSQATQASGSFGGVAPGQHTLRVTDANGCSRDTTLQVIQYAPMQVQVSQRQAPSCADSADGAITLQAQQGKPPYAFSKGGGSFQASPHFSGLAAGQHTFWIRDAHRCMERVTVQLDAPEPLAVAVAHQLAASCARKADGMAQLRALGGTAPYTYQLDSAAATPDSLFTALAPGPHSVRLKDAHGCVAQTDFTIQRPDSLRLALDSLAHLRCAGQATGVVELVASGGTQPYHYEHAGQLQSHGLFQQLGAGQHRFTLTDSNGCSVEDTVLLQAPAALQLQLKALQAPTCAAAQNGRLQFRATGGQPPYRTAGGRLLQADSVYSRSDLRAGPLTISLTDRKGCRTTRTLQLNPAYAPSGLGDTLLCGAELTLPEPALPGTWQVPAGAEMTGKRLVLPPRRGDTLQLVYRSAGSRACNDTMQVFQAPEPTAHMASQPSLPATLRSDSAALALEAVAPAPNVQYEWRFGDGNSAQGPSVHHRYEAPGHYTLMLEANNRYGCASRVANAVHVRLSEQPPNPPAPQQALTIPNVFTPNGDGVNEGFGNFFGPAGLATPSQYRLRIYDRWGNQVYSTDAAPQRWQGRHEGQPASEGTYFYQLSYEQADGERVERSGEVTLLR